MARLGAARKDARSAGKRKRRFRFEPGETPKRGVTRVARNELDLAIGLLEAAPNGDGGAEAIHEARKSLKRLRALLRVSRPALDERRYRRENSAFRDAGRGLSEARDAQVLLQTLDSLTERFSDELAPGTWTRLREDLAARAERTQANGARGFDDVLEVLTKAQRRVSHWPLPSQNGRASLAEGFDGIYRRGRQALRRARAKPTPENLHELRKRAKDLWHAAQLLEPACPGRMKRVSRRAHRLANLLGDDHDLSVLLEYGDRHPKLLSKTEHGLLEKLVDRRRRKLRPRAFKCADSVYGRKPKRMLRRLALAT